MCGSLFAFSMNTSYYDIIGQIGYWAQSYWGGSVACLGSALALGSVLWFGQVTKKHPANATALLTAFVIGLWLLAISRPLEGLLVCIPLSICMLSHWIESIKSGSMYLVLKDLLVPLLVGISGAFWIGHYQSSVTGSPFRLPYLCYEKQYALTPTFLAQPLRKSKGYTNEPMRIFHEEWEAGIFRSQQNWDGYFAEKTAKLCILWKFFLGWSLTIPALMGGIVSAVSIFKNRTSACARLGWMGGASVGLVILVHSQTVWMNPHYLAPLTPILWGWIGGGLASLSSWTLFKLEVGLLLALSFVGFSAMLMLSEFDTHWSTMANAQGWQHRRDEIETKLLSTKGTHLILIDYDDAHSPHQEWCYNSADIDGSKVVWARDLGQDKNLALLQYFENRIVYKLAVDSGDAQLETVRDAVPGGR
jgi:hypothetical protein